VNAGFFCVHLRIIFSRKGAKTQRKKEMEENFQVLDSEQGDVVITFDGCNYRLSQLISAMSKLLVKDDQQELDKELKNIGCTALPGVEDINNWTNNGVKCEVLKPGKNWQKGKGRIKVSIEFCPDEPEIVEIKEPESPLDDLRRKINDATTS
jgi:hypothetical protein